jgi:hypothetical protein
MLCLTAFGTWFVSQVVIMRTKLKPHAQGASLRPPPACGFNQSPRPLLTWRNVENENLCWLIVLPWRDDDILA